MTMPIWERPVFFERNRVFRVYLGGKLFGDFLGDAPEDGFYPEEWIASSVHALNADSKDSLEGISIVEGTDRLPFSQLLEEHREACLGQRENLGVLVKFLDSAIRLPMQVHPTRAFSRQYFHSPYGKAESWVILATRPDACIYYGFSRKVSREEFEAAVDRSEQDKSCMTEFVNRVPVKPGDVFFVPAGVIHAIGAGCLLLEAQEPTDFTVQPEHWCGDYHLNDHEMYLGLSREVAGACFDYDRYGQEVLDQGKITPTVLAQNQAATVDRLIGPAQTDCFTVDRLRLSGTELYTLEEGAAVYIAVAGSGSVRCGDFSHDVSKGGYFFLPAAAAGKTVVEGALELVCCKGGR
ncbi:class I mannose-6-phosphate isomerase [Intestinimonas timonensis]|uniref:class I mannose-6-phosphate isomerase n=1 Tax=Intestinimonas timonensis TaxID=1689270 RepID=UPI00103110CF|nr:class I mannose-6-phosphate isomerase [Intestinimonas timonensis]